MANWYGHARTNYFRVKDQEAFAQWAKSRGNLEVIRDAEGRVGLLSDHEYGGWPDFKYDEATDETQECDLFQDVAAHLQEGSVAVFMEVGAEKLRYLTGFALAVNSQGETVETSLDGIYELAKSLGDEVTEAEY
jgi:hypothetical protein